jgi:predicted O-linked N-acetylglucosamine transferase (SPINDLY family)
MLCCAMLCYMLCHATYLCYMLHAAVWMSVLRRQRGSAVLLLLHPGRDAARNLLAQAAAHGIAPARLYFVPKVSQESIVV